MKILIINGPNLNMLGRREPEIYGHETFENILRDLRKEFSGHEILYYQSNIEGELVGRIQQILEEDINGLVVNMGAYTHYSYAILDALKMVSIPKVEVHLSHLFTREEFRHTSVISPACHGLISGFGKYGYTMAINWLLQNQGVK